MVAVLKFSCHYRNCFLDGGVVVFETHCLRTLLRCSYENPLHFTMPGTPSIENVMHWRKKEKHIVSDQVHRERRWFLLTTLPFSFKHHRFWKWNRSCSSFACEYDSGSDRRAAQCHRLSWETGLVNDCRCHCPRKNSSATFTGPGVSGRTRMVHSLVTLGPYGQGTWSQSPRPHRPSLAVSLACWLTQLCKWVANHSQSPPPGLSGKQLFVFISIHEIAWACFHFFFASQWVGNHDSL